MARKVSKKRCCKKIWLYLVLGIIALLVILAVTVLIFRQGPSSGALAGEASRSCVKGTFSNNKVCDGKVYIICTTQLKDQTYGDYICSGEKWVPKQIYFSCITLSVQIKMFGCESDPKGVFAVICDGLLDSAKALNCP